MQMNASGNPFNQEEFEAALEALEAAKAALKANPCGETRLAKSAARNAASAVAPKRKGSGGFACRAGRRQHAERKAIADERQREAARRTLYRKAGETK